MSEDNKEPMEGMGEAEENMDNMDNMEEPVADDMEEAAPLIIGAPESSKKSSVDSKW